MELHIYGCHDEQGPTGEDPIVIMIINTAWFACVCTLIFILVTVDKYTHTHTIIHLYFFPLQNQLSGYLLRKFKNSHGWQKLWVVFTNFCLFFYKTHQVRPALFLSGHKS